MGVVGAGFLGLTCGRGGSLAAAAAPPVSSFSCALLESVCHLAAGPGGFLSPTTTIASVTSAGGKQEGGARGGAKGTVPGTAQKMSKRQAFASAVPAAGGGISISQRSAASKVFREMLLIAFPAPALGGWVESPSPGTSRWVWHRLFVTGALERSIRHSLVSGVGGLRALMGAEDLGLSCCGIKGDLVKNRPRDSSGSSAQAGWAQAGGSA